MSVAPSAHAEAISVLRVDQVGYLPTDHKHAYLMTSSDIAAATWDAVDANGKVVARGDVNTNSRGPWNANYADVYDVDFSSLTKLGTYRLHVHGDVTDSSPVFKVESAQDLYGQVLADGVNFYQVQRDGTNVIPGALDRKPAHQNDANAGVYTLTTGADPDSGAIINQGPLKLHGLCATETGTANHSPVTLQTCNGSKAQDWSINPDDSSSQIVNTASGKCLAVNHAAAANGAIVDVYTCFDTSGDPDTNQQWVAQTQGIGNTTEFQNQSSLRCLNDKDGSNTSGATLQIWDCHAASPNEQVQFNTGIKKVGGPVNVEGGWYDAGDFLKFTHTAAYGDVLLYASQRALGNQAPASLGNEAAYGEDWLSKVWNQKTKTLYFQVGIGSGDNAGTYFGDHDIWRLPEADNGDTSPADYYAGPHRPVFAANTPGQPVSPNLAGRTAAAFALAAQVDATSNKAKALQEYTAASSLYALAATKNPPNPLVTALPEAFYPELSWHDDMELGGAELALAAQKLGKSTDASSYLKQSATWANAYITNDAKGLVDPSTGEASVDTFNLYDTSALAHTDLARAMDAAGDPKLAVTRGQLVADLKRQVTLGDTHSDQDPFRAAGDVFQFDVDSHTFGWIAMEAWYASISGDHQFDAFAAEQRDWLFGDNAWGTSFMIGEGTTFPDCPQHQVANLAGNLNGKGPKLAIGAVVNGPNNTSNFDGGLGDLQDGMKQCPVDAVDPFASFNIAPTNPDDNSGGSQFSDDVRSWQTDEPALDMTGAAIIASASQLALHK